MNAKQPNHYSQCTKLAFDQSVFLISLILLSPVLLLRILFSAIRDRGQPIFVHEHSELPEQTVQPLKQRTNKDRLGDDDRQPCNTERVSPLGHWVW